MSADNWTTCPKCADTREKDIAAHAVALAGMYGKVPLAEFDAARELDIALIATPLKETMREDYEFYGANEGIVHWSYSASCTECGLSARTSGEYPIWPPKEN